jgi:hypothetical protein
MNRRKAISKKCLDCSAGNMNDLIHCEHPECSLYHFRLQSKKQDATARNRAIKSYCFYCANGQINEISICISVDCPLYSFRGYNKDEITSNLPSEQAYTATQTEDNIKVVQTPTLKTKTPQTASI